MAKRRPPNPRSRPDTETSLFPPNATLSDLAQAAKNCKNCDLWKHATQTVFGEGQPGSKIMLLLVWQL